MINDEIEQKLFFSAIGAFYEVYNVLGFGFLESFYIRALEWELRERGHDVAREVGIRVGYKVLDLGTQRLDMILDGKLVIETKSTVLLPPFASRQIFNYLRGSNLEAGLLLHFGPKPEFHKIFCRPHQKMIPSIPTDSEHVKIRGAKNP
jgi:GxxExxY protein